MEKNPVKKIDLEEEIDKTNKRKQEDHRQMQRKIF